MDRVIEIAPDADVTRLRCDRGVELTARHERVRHSADAALVVLRGGSLVARCSCWWRNAPVLDGDRVGLIGHYAAADRDAAAALLDRASGMLAGNGCCQAIGPVDGSTWRRYRFVDRSGPEYPFFLEPENPGHWPCDWKALGFAAVATYTSAITDDLALDVQRLAVASDALATARIAVRPLDLSRVEAELDAIFRLSLVSFARNFLYSPIDSDEFLESSRALLPFIHPELTLLAEQSGQLVGFVMALPDALQARRGTPVDTLIVKTVAVDPAVAGLGVGGALVALVHDRGRRFGFRRAIHALMHDGNVSQRISRRNAGAFRRYVVLGKKLAASGGGL
jgi:GNAT superfamily N-acetyltransferase